MLPAVDLGGWVWRRRCRRAQTCMCGTVNALFALCKLHYIKDRRVTQIQRMDQVARSEPADAFLAWAAVRDPPDTKTHQVAPQGLLEVPYHIRGCTKSVIQLLCRHSRVRGSPGENALDAVVPRYPPNRFVLSCTHFRKHLAPVSNDPSLLSSAASARWSSTKRLA